MCADFFQVKAAGHQCYWPSCYTRGVFYWPWWTVWPGVGPSVAQSDGPLLLVKITWPEGSLYINWWNNQRDFLILTHFYPVTAWNSWGLNKPQEVGRVLTLPLLPVRRWNDFTKGLRLPHEGRPEEHLLYHWREQRVCAELCLCWAAAEARVWGPVHDWPHWWICCPAVERVWGENTDCCNQGGARAPGRRGGEEKTGGGQGEVREPLQDHEGDTW